MIFTERLQNRTDYHRPEASETHRGWSDTYILPVSVEKQQLLPAIKREWTIEEQVSHFMRVHYISIPESSNDFFRTFEWSRLNENRVKKYGCGERCARFFFLNGRFVSKQKVRKNDFKFGKNFDFDYWRSMIGGDDFFFIWTIRKVIILCIYIYFK